MFEDENRITSAIETVSCSFRSLEAVKIIVIFILSRFLSDSHKEIIGSARCIDFRKREQTNHLHGPFTKTGVAGMLEAFYFEAVDVTFSFLVQWLMNFVVWIKLQILQGWFQNSLIWSILCIKTIWVLDGLKKSLILFFIKLDCLKYKRISFLRIISRGKWKQKNGTHWITFAMHSKTRGTYLVFMEPKLSIKELLKIFLLVWESSSIFSHQLSPWYQRELWYTR